jgi:hypothetical protein
MKKSLCLTLLLALTHPLWAGAGDSHPFYIGIGTGADIPGSNWDPDDYLGGGARVFTGLEADKNWAAQLDLQEWFFTGGGNSLDNFRLLAEAKYTFDGQGLQPYLLAGPGIIFQSISPSGDSTANFEVLGGLGIQFNLAPRTHLFLETQANFILSQTTAFTDFPVTAGLRVGL